MTYFDFFFFFEDVETSYVSQVKLAWESQRKAYTSQFFELDPCTVIILSLSSFERFFFLLLFLWLFCVGFFFLFLLWVEAHFPFLLSLFATILVVVLCQ